MNRNSQGRPFNNFPGYLTPQHQQAQYINSPPPPLEGTGRFAQTSTYNGRSVVQGQGQAGNVNSAPVPGAPAARFEGQIPFHNPPGNQWITSHMIPQQMVPQGGHVQRPPYMYQQTGQHPSNAYTAYVQNVPQYQMSLPRPPSQAPQTTTFSSGIQQYQHVPLQTHAQLTPHVPPQLQTARPVQMTPTMPNQQIMSASQGTPTQYGPSVQQMNHLLSHQTPHQNPQTLQKRVPKPLTVIDPKTKRPVDLKETGSQSVETEATPAVTADAPTANDADTKRNVSVPVTAASTFDTQKPDAENLQEGTLNPAADIFFPNQDISAQPTTRSTPEKESERCTPESTPAVPESSATTTSDDVKEEKPDEESVAATESVAAPESVVSDSSKLRTATPEVGETAENQLSDVQADAADETVSEKAVDDEQQITECKQNLESTEPVVPESAPENPSEEHEEVPNGNGTREPSENDGPSQDEDELESATSSPPPYNFRADSVEAPATTALRKLHYDRNYLINLQRCKAALRQPDGLPEELIEQGVILKKANPLDLTKPLPALKSKGMDDFTPDYARLSQYSSRGGRYARDGPRPQGSGGPGSRYSNTASNQRRGSQQSSRKIEVVHRQPVKIHQSENAYVPAILQRNRGRNNNPEEESEEARMQVEKNRRQRICFSQLNKLTPQNSDVIFDQIRDSGILCDGAGIDDIASAIFKKAISEPPYSVALADLVSKIMGEYESDEMQKHKTFFKQTLLSRCQTMFETDLEKQVSEEEDKMRKKMEEEKDAKIKAMLSEEIEETKLKVRLKYYGNIKFVGELYLRGLVGAKTIHDCVAMLLQHKTEESIESVCKFLETTGQKLDQGQAMKRVDHYFARIEKIKEKIDSQRLKFKLEDLIDMRNRQWKLRERAAEYQVRPRTRAELERERIEEETKKQAAVDKMVARKREESRYGNRGGGYSGRPSGGPIGSLMGSGRRSLQPEQTNQAMVNSDGWKTITRRVDPRSLTIKNDGNEADVKLGPGTSMVSKWSQGCRTKGKESGDRVSATKNFGRQGLSPSPRNSANSSRRGSNSNIPAAVSSGATASVSTGGRESAAAERIESEQPRNGAPGTESGAVSSFTPERPPVDSKMRTTIENKSQHIFSEYSAHKEFDVHAFEPIKLYGDIFVDCLIQHVIEKSKVGRIDAGNMVAMMLQKGYLRAEDITEGLKPHFEAAADILMDVPKFFSYIAEFLSGCFCDEIMQALPSIMHNLEQENEVANVVCEMLHLASEANGHDKVGTMFRTAGLDWHMFLSPSMKMDTFIQSNKLEFTLTGGVPKVPDSSISLEDLEMQLQELICKSKLKIEDVFSLLESSVDKRTSNSPEFISMVIRTIASVSIRNSDFDLLHNCSPVLKYIIDKDTGRMLTALFAIQQITPKTKDPSRINAAFEVLSDSEVISDKAYHKYYEMEQPEISEGYDQTIRATANFFATLMNT